MSHHIYVLNGPNLNMLGKRQPEIYGSDTIEVAQAKSSVEGITTSWMQSNYEGELVTWIQEAREKAAGIVINPGAYSHTSIAILDALNNFEGPVAEVHISNIHAREEFRHHSFVSKRANAIFVGCGIEGYHFALKRMKTLLG